MNSFTYFSILNYKMHNIYISIISHYLQLLPERGEVRRRLNQRFRMEFLNENCTGAVQEDFP